MGERVRRRPLWNDEPTRVPPRAAPAVASASASILAIPTPSPIPRTIPRVLAPARTVQSIRAPEAQIPLSKRLRRPHPLRSVVSARSALPSSSSTSSTSSSAPPPPHSPPVLSKTPHTPLIRPHPAPTSTIRRLKTVFEETPPHLRALESGWREQRKKLGVEVAEIVRVAGERRDRERDREERDKVERDREREREREERGKDERVRERRDLGWGRKGRRVHRKASSSDNHGGKKRGEDRNTTTTRNAKDPEDSKDTRATTDTKNAQHSKDTNTNPTLGASPSKPALRDPDTDREHNTNRTIRWKDPVSVSYSVAAGLLTPPSSPVIEPRPETCHQDVDVWAARVPPTVPAVLSAVTSALAHSVVTPSSAPTVPSVPSAASDAPPFDSPPSPSSAPIRPSPSITSTSLVSSKRVPSSPGRITSHPLPPTTTTLKSGHTITVHSPQSANALTIAHGSTVARINRAGDEVVLGTRVLRLMELDDEGTRTWRKLEEAVRGLKRVTPYIKVYTPLGDVVLTACAPPDVVLTFTLNAAGVSATPGRPALAHTSDVHSSSTKDSSETKVRIRYSLLCSEYVLDTAARNDRGETFKSRRAGRLDPQVGGTYAALGIPESESSWGHAEAEAVRRLWALRGEWRGYVV